MHGLDLKEKEFLKADLREVNLRGTDLRGAVINTSQLQGADLRDADLSDVVGFASHFEAPISGGQFHQRDDDAEPFYGRADRRC